MFSISDYKVNINLNINIDYSGCRFVLFCRQEPVHICIAVHVTIVMDVGYEDRRQVFVQAPSVVIIPMQHSLCYKTYG